MRITVNGENINYALENETNLFEVLAGLRDWLERSGFVMTAAQMDGRELDMKAEGALRTTSLGPIGEISVSARPLVEMDYDDLEAIRGFFRLTREGVEAGNAGDVLKLLKNYPTIRDNIGRILDRHGISPVVASPERLDALFVESGLTATGTLDSAGREKLFELIALLDRELDERMREISDPQGELKRAAGNLTASIGELQEVSIMLQTGRDADAMQAIVRFTELSSKLVRLYPLLRFRGHTDFDAVKVDNLPFSDFYVEFNGVLSELIDAFSAGDSILIGDLLEYEVAPRLEKLRAYVDLLVKG